MKKEHFRHDDCRECGSQSIPAEEVPDQTLRECVKCGHMWFENLDQPPHTQGQFWTPEKLNAFKLALAKATAAKAETFSFEGNEYLPAYARYVVEYVEGRFKEKPDTFTSCA